MKLKSSGASHTKYTGVTEANRNTAANPAARPGLDPLAARYRYASATLSVSSSAWKTRKPVVPISHTNGEANSG